MYFNSIYHQFGSNSIVKWRILEPPMHILAAIEPQSNYQVVD